MLKLSIMLALGALVAIGLCGCASPHRVGGEWLSIVLGGLGPPGPRVYVLYGDGRLLVKDADAAYHYTVNFEKLLDDNAIRSIKSKVAPAVKALIDDSGRPIGDGTTLVIKSFISSGQTRVEIQTHIVGAEGRRLPDLDALWAALNENLPNNLKLH